MQIVMKKKAERKLQEKINAYKMQNKIVFTVPSEYLEDKARKGILADYRIYKIANGLNIEQFKINLIIQAFLIITMEKKYYHVQHIGWNEKDCTIFIN